MTRYSCAYENGIIKNLTLEETIKEFNKIQYSKKVKSWNNKYDDDELLEFCYLGLMKAYNYYDINSKNNIFISYACILFDKWNAIK